MTEVECAHMEEFVNSGRTGRRNAMSDVLNDPVAKVGTGDLTYELDKLSCDSKDGKDPAPSQASASDNKGQGS